MNPKPGVPPSQTTQSSPIPAASPIPSPTPTPAPARLLTICLGREPDSLFLYADQSIAARAVREAIYDGPLDVLNYAATPVILEKMPDLAGGDAYLEAVQVRPKDLIVDGSGNLVNLEEGVTYHPDGCTDSTCVTSYTGQEPVTMDQLVVRFRLRPGLLWSDGQPLTAADSVYSFDLARSLYPGARAELIARTQSYQALDEITVEWRGVPGFRDPRYALNFFTPLPRHAWGSLSPDDLLAFEGASRTPLGWGPYKIDEWTPGDHITLSRNPSYFRAAEGLPKFDALVFRFMSGAEEALQALLTGECDMIDETLNLESISAQLLELQGQERLGLAFETGSAWEHIDFGILSYASPDQAAPLPLFESREMRQAIARCIDRQRLADELFIGKSSVPDTYLPANHPLANPDVVRYGFDPGQASAQLEALGWKDLDGDPDTPRTSQGVRGVPDGAPLAFAYLTTREGEKPRAAQIIKESLAQCGVQIDVQPGDWQALLAPGPEGPVFGRDFSMAQYAWVTAFAPPCFLYTSQEIPGPYPEYPKGWGGANAPGYSNPLYDQACRQALNSLPDSPNYRLAHDQAQAIYAEDLPSLPLYLRLKLAAMRPDLCGVLLDPSADSALWNLENFDYGEGCPP